MWMFERGKQEEGQKRWKFRGKGWEDKASNFGALLNFVGYVKIQNL